MKHVAVVKPRYLHLILSGQKRAELRLSKNRCAPFGQVRAGDTVYFKQTGGPYGARATVRRVDSHDFTSEADIERLRREVNGVVLGDDAYWRSKAQAKHGTVVWLEGITPTTRGPKLPPLYGRGWVVLPAPSSNRARRVPA